MRPPTSHGQLPFYFERMVIKLGVRYRRFYGCCKDRKNCNGKVNKDCPVNELPKKENGKPYKCGTWLVELFDENKVWQSMAFKDVRSKADAEKRLALLIADRERGMLKLPKRKVIPTLTEYSKTYLELHKQARENTLAMKKRAINVLSEYLGSYRLDQIIPFIIEKFRVQRKERDKVKDSVINVDVQVLSHIFNTAIGGGVIDKNPCQGIKRLKVTQVKDRVLSNDEIAIILNTPDNKDRLMMLTGLFSGMRLNEVLSLGWQDIDFGRGIIHVTQSKTGKILDIPLSGYLREELLQYKTESTGNKVFEDRIIKHAVVHEYSTHFSQLFKDMGIHGFTFHNLRHTFSSLLQSNLGIGAVVVQGMTGHSSLSMLQKYSHTGLDAKQEAINALTDHVLNTGKGINKVVGF